MFGYGLVEWRFMLTWIKLTPINLEYYSCIEKKTFQVFLFPVLHPFWYPAVCVGLWHGVSDTVVFLSVYGTESQLFQNLFWQGQYLFFWYLFYPFLLYQENLSFSDTYRRYKTGGLIPKICCEFVCMKYLLRLLEDLKNIWNLKFIYGKWEHSPPPLTTFEKENNQSVWKYVFISTSGPEPCGKVGNIKKSRFCSYHGIYGTRIVHTFFPNDDGWTIETKWSLYRLIQ